MSSVVSHEKYANAGQQRLLRVMLALSGYEVQGIAPGELAKGLGLDPSNVTRDLANLALADLAEEIVATGRWRLSPRLVRIGVAMQLSVDAAERKLDEIKHRYTREPR